MCLFYNLLPFLELMGVNIAKLSYEMLLDNVGLHIQVDEKTEMTSFEREEGIVIYS